MTESRLDIPHTPIRRGRVHPARGKSPIPSLSPELYTPGSSTEDDNEPPIFSPASSVQTAVTEDYDWDTPTRKPTTERDHSPCPGSGGNTPFGLELGEQNASATSPSLRGRRDGWVGLPFGVSTVKFDPVGDGNTLSPKNKKNILRQTDSPIKRPNFRNYRSSATSANDVHESRDGSEVNNAGERHSKPTFLVVSQVKTDTRRYSKSLDTLSLNSQNEGTKYQRRPRSQSDPGLRPSSLRNSHALRSKEVAGVATLSGTPLVNHVAVVSPQRTPAQRINIHELDVLRRESSIRVGRSCPRHPRSASVDAIRSGRSRLPVGNQNKTFTAQRRGTPLHRKRRSAEFPVPAPEEPSGTYPQTLSQEAAPYDDSLHDQSGTGLMKIFLSSRGKRRRPGPSCPKRRRVDPLALQQGKVVRLDLGTRGPDYRFTAGATYHQRHDDCVRLSRTSAYSTQEDVNSQIRFTGDAAPVPSSQGDPTGSVVGQSLTTALQRYIQDSVSENGSRCLAVLIAKSDNKGGRCTRRHKSSEASILRNLNKLINDETNAISPYTDLLKSALCTQHQKNAEKISFWERLLHSNTDITHYLAQILEHVPGVSDDRKRGKSNGQRLPPREQNLPSPLVSPSPPPQQIRQMPQSTGQGICSLQKFEPYVPKSQEGISVDQLLKRIIKKPLLSCEIERVGFIYMYWVPPNFGYVKIGLSGNVKQRMMGWKSQCRKTPYLHYPTGDDSLAPVPHIYRVEKLIHAELSQYRRIEACSGCAVHHKEWFQLDDGLTHNIALQIIDKWTKWMLERPYVQGPGGGDWVLADAQSRRIEELIKPHEKLRASVS